MCVARIGDCCMWTTHQLVYSHILVHNAITFVLEYGVIFV